ncbi:MAG: hypothetical protein N3B10_09715 [Armatimonadetes bacterium]|nr:hypothetical protein [Armatimonadota bacterium]
MGVTVKELPTPLERHGLNLLCDRLTALLSVLGFDVFELEKTERLEDTIGEQLLNLLIEVRGQLRQRRLYDLADLVRGRLLELGIVLEDTPQGTRWRRS